MLIEFNVENYLSLKNKQTFSLIANKSNELEENIFTVEGNVNLNVLKSAVIYGANAAGKSNVLLAVRAMMDIVTQSASSTQAGEEVPVFPFKLDSDSIKNPTEFEVTFIAEGIRYQFGFSATNERIIDEWLFAYPKGRPQKWYFRAWDEEKQEYEWDFGASLLGEKQVWQRSTRNNALFLSTAVQLNSEQLKPVFTWFKKTLRLSGIKGWANTFSAKRCTEDTKKDILNFLKAADIGIDDVLVTKEKFNPDDLPSDMPDDIKKIVISNMKDKDIFDVTTVHYNDKGEPVSFSLEEESHGTQKLFSLAGPWLDALDNGYVLFIDELHDTLHPKLVSFLVNLFNSPDTNKKGAQLIFSTHETSILNQSIFRRDQVWFCEKNELSETNLYPLTDFSPRKGRENLEAAYLDGRYGALPFIKKLTGI
ncbi:TPA: ATP-binding protein [Klebsiella pneumoniae subsp. pneumoniae]|uniref:AAA family ATPase n=1 Tax=Klebsiella pneumoniae TaxID=573 RepID=UPI00080904DC|nr:ATP-binding protein [Klebsiella pneumoniae]HBQ5786801.1 ATP-binding protein [Klebsiella pneumoniae subsp. pneumoniae]MDR4743278.1 ATP-binding protein [Klebsiella pneumoniae]SBZ86689.1 Predicted ATPase [Klebsiella pneumoniae]SXU47199.1 Predicted ATPase [Klebsiella pneumoniae]VTT41185.1 Predicted ATPase [Klebsiella pneumoniae]